MKMKNNSESPASICRPFECDGIEFTIRITYPRRYEGTAKPCEGKVTPVPSPDFCQSAEAGFEIAPEAGIH